ncbi:mechanosensitive ion channel family protein [Bacillus sp. Bva_UNVM-123]|uniref:mechanosensitive ion channel family protein n=1 Tax=Bacillus sp. Bva_UNVM-123 TaxID=2829798 RepID=UPI00391FA05B
MGKKTVEFWEFISSYENLEDIGISIGIFLLFLIFRKIFTKYVFALLLKIGRKAPGDLLSQVLLAFERPLQWLFVVIGIYVSVQYFPHFDEKNLLFLKIVRSSIIIIITWGLFNLASVSSMLFAKINEKTNIEIDEILIPFLSKTLRFIIVAISISVIAQEFSYDVNGFVAGLGLGGLAFALAAKDALGNLFGGIVIITEKPFSIGDWIKTPSVEGTVEDITFRSTKVRTFTQALVTMPNATLANEAIMNWSKMGKRQITFNLKVNHETSKEKLQSIIEQIESHLKNHPGVHQETIFVKFNQYLDNGLEIFVYFFTKTTNWGEYLKIKEEINFEMMTILEKEEVFVALPSRKIYLDSEAGAQKKAEELRQKS